MLFSVEQAFVGREEMRAPLKTPAWEATVQLYLLLFPFVENFSGTLSKQVLGPEETIHRASQSNLENWNSK